MTANARLAVVISAASEGGSTWRVPVKKWHLVDIEEGRVVADGEVGVSSASVASFSPDGTRIAFGGEEEDLAILAMPDGDVIGGAGSPDSSRLVASAESGLQPWDASSGTAIAQVRSPAGEVSSAAGFASDGSISIATLAGNLYRWDPSSQAAVEFACQDSGRDLTTAEWRDAFGDRPFRPTCP